MRYNGKYSLKRALLTEAAIGIKDLPEDTYIAIDDMDDEIAIFYCDADGNSLKLGNINMEEPPRAAGPCNGAYLITWVEASKGYGPLLYDLAMEYATRKGGGLTADRKTVQDDAIKVWDYYATRRSIGKNADVSPIQLDDFDRENKEKNTDRDRHMHICFILLESRIAHSTNRSHATASVR